MTTTTPTKIPTGAPRLGQHLIEVGRTQRLDDLYPIAEVLGCTNPRSLVATITFRYGPAHHQTGTVTGFALQSLFEGDQAEDNGHGGCRVVMVSAGCAYGERPYLIPAGATIEKIATR